MFGAFHSHLILEMSGTEEYTDVDVGSYSTMLLSLSMLWGAQTVDNI